MDIDKGRWYTSRQAAEILNVHHKTLVRYFNENRLWGKKNPTGKLWITLGEALYNYPEWWEPSQQVDEKPKELTKEDKELTTQNTRIAKMKLENEEKVLRNQSKALDEEYESIADFKNKVVEFSKIKAQAEKIIDQAKEATNTLKNIQPIIDNKLENAQKQADDIVLKAEDEKESILFEAQSKKNKTDELYRQAQEFKSEWESKARHISRLEQRRDELIKQQQPLLQLMAVAMDRVEKEKAKYSCHLGNCEPFSWVEEWVKRFQAITANLNIKLKLGGGKRRYK